MTDASIGPFVLAGVSALCAVIAHWRIRRYFLASLISALAAALSFQVLVTLQLGHVDPFAPVAFVMSLLVTAAIALLAGLPFVASRRAASKSGP